MLVDAGRAFLLKVITGQISPEGFKMGLYTNTVSWTRSTLLAGLTEPTQSGYTRQDIPSWDAPTVLAGGEGSTVDDAVVFQDTDVTPIVAKGFFYVSASTGVFLGGDNFPAPLTIPASSGSLSIFPQLIDSTYP